jgi:LPXTG-site transpeptidase (sortase) family protein
MNEVTPLPTQPLDKAYASYSDLWLEIPKLGVKLPIVGVPSTSTGWDVTWLGRNAGWLDGSAFPTWDGNSVITAHVWDAFNQPGPFAKLKDLKYGDQVKIHAFGQVYTYEIRESRSIAPSDQSRVFKHEEKPWLTLLTCEDYKELSKTYSHRRMVKAVLISVTKEK